MSEPRLGEPEPHAVAALEVFGGSGPLEQKIRGLKELMKGGAIHAFRDDPRFTRGVENSIREAKFGQDAQQKLFALTVLARLASRVKAMRAQMSREMSAALDTCPPPLSELSDAEDRFYAAQALAHASGDWVVPYLARSVVEEETGEKARSELVRTLLQKASELSYAFQALSEPLKEWKPETEAPGDTAAKRLKRILSALRPELLLSDTPAGDDLGLAIKRLISAAFHIAGPPTAPSVLVDVTAEIALFLHDLVRTRFSLAVEASTYSALRVPSRWFLSGRWPDDASDALELLSRDIAEAIALLAKQGVTDDELLGSLILVAGSREAALRITSRIAGGTTGLAKEVVGWLERGRVTAEPKGTSLMAESGRLAADPTLALILLDSRRVIELLDGPGRDLLNEVGIFEPSLETSTKTLLEKSRALADAVRALAAKRSLRIRGEVGDVVEYSPVEQEGIHGPIVGARRVKIVRPLVERVRSDGTADIVVKAAVEPA